jgi:hypothetical protein
VRPDVTRTIKINGPSTGRAEARHWACAEGESAIPQLGNPAQVPYFHPVIGMLILRPPG